jgi:hypothetical protein
MTAKTTRWVALTLLTALSAATSGCSWAFMQKAPDPVLTPNYPVECSSSKAAPVLDSVCAGYFVANTVFLASMTSCADASFGEACYESSTKTSAMLFSAGLAGLCALSAANGFKSANRCGSVKGLNAACITGNEQACYTLSPRWTPRGRAAPGWGEAPATGPSALPAGAPAAAPAPSAWEQPSR